MILTNALSKIWVRDNRDICWQWPLRIVFQGIYLILIYFFLPLLSILYYYNSSQKMHVCLSRKGAFISGPKNVTKFSRARTGGRNLVPV
jgi:hypothetical protein